MSAENGWRSAISVARRAVKTIAVIVAVCLLATALLGALGGFWWPLELFAHFRIVYLALALACGLLALTVSWRWTLLVLAAALPHLFVILEPALTSPNAHAAVPGTAKQANARAHKLRLLVFNVAFINKRTGELLELIDRENPDVIVLQEFAFHWREVLPALKARYPHRALGYEVQSDSTIISRFPIRNAQVLQQTFGPFPPLRADIDVGGTTIRLISVHTALPLSRGGYDNQNLYLKRLSEDIRRSKTPVIVAGDFNLTHWTARLSRFAEANGLRRVAPTGLIPQTRFQPGLGWLTPLFGLPIDHVYVRGPIRRKAARIGEDIGSDHRPLIVDLVVFATRRPK